MSENVTQGFADLLCEADEIVRGKFVWKRFIDGTPLSNDVPVWMAEFALKQVAALTADLARLTAELERSRRECEGLREAVDHYDKALLAACPEGAQGAAHDHWNEARKRLAALSAGGSDGNA